MSRRTKKGQLNRHAELVISELLSFADDLELSDAERLRLTFIIGNLMTESWQEGYEFGWKWGWHSGGDDVLFTQGLTNTRIISH